MRPLSNFLHKKLESRRSLACGLTIAGALFRLVPHPVNFASVGALSVFAGARLGGWQSYAVPVLALLASDPILGWMLGYPVFTAVTPFVWAAFLVYVWIGSRLRTTLKAGRIASFTFLGSLQFFLISNFGVWVAGSSYPHSLGGLASCYAAAIPFFANTALSDLVYVGVLFGLHSRLSRVVSPEERAHDAVSSNRT